MREIECTVITGSTTDIVPFVMLFLLSWFIFESVVCRGNLGESGSSCIQLLAYLNMVLNTLNK